MRVCARTSLFLLDEPGMDTWLRDRLHAGDDGERATILGQLTRLSAPQLAGFSKEIKAIAVNPREPEFLRERATKLIGK